MSESYTLNETITLEERESEAEPAQEEKYRLAELVVYKNCKYGIGIKICGGCTIDGEVLQGVYVRRILPGGLAEKQGGLEIGDQILKVNGESLEGVVYERALSHMRIACYSDHVELVVCRDDEAKAEFEEIMAKERAHKKQQSKTDGDQRASGEQVDYDDDDDGIDTDQEQYITPTETQQTEYAHHPRLKLKTPGPAMSSTPLHRGLCMGDPVDSGSSPGEVLSPVKGPVLCLAKALSHTTIGDRSHIMQEFTIDPDDTVKVENVLSAVSLLGIEMTADKEARLLSQLNIDRAGNAQYGEVVDAVRDLYGAERLTTSILGKSALSKMNGGASGYLPGQSEIEMEELRQENHRLQMLLHEKEEELQFHRKEERKMRSKVHLAAKATKVAREMEHDYEEVVHLLEGEIAQLKMQAEKRVENDPLTLRRIAVLTCQLRKAENEKTMLQAANDKLLQFAEHVRDSVGKPTNGAASRPLNSGKLSGLLHQGKQPAKTSPTNTSLANKATETIQCVKSLLDTQTLPYGWEERYTEDGIKYYVSHLNQITTWTHPLSKVSHLPMNETTPPTSPDDNTAQPAPDS